jgi:hypothetical protein
VASKISLQIPHKQPAVKPEQKQALLEGLHTHAVKNYAKEYEEDGIFFGPVTPNGFRIVNAKIPHGCIRCTDLHYSVELHLSFPLSLYKGKIADGIKTIVKEYIAQLLGLFGEME